MTEEKNVASPSPRVVELECKRELTRDLLSGTPGMIRAGKKWLLQHPAETDGNYKIRLENNTLSNFLAQAIAKAQGKVFAKEIKTKDLLPEIEALLENIDLQGRNLDAFAMDLLNAMWADGISFVLVETPKSAGVRTKADEKARNIRPYAIHIKACCLLETMSEMIDGVQTLTRIRVKERTQVPEGEWGYREQERVRVLKRDPVSGAVLYQIWEEQEKAGTSGKEWVNIEEGFTSMQRIALVPFYANRVGYMEGEPPFQATAELNLDHWRVKSEQKNALTMNNFEMLAATGVDEDKPIVVGPAQCLKSGSADAKYYYLSPSGTGVGLSAGYLKEIEAQIETAAASLRVENGGDVTATAAALDSEEGCAGVKAVAEGAGDSLELVVSYMLEMMGLDATKTGDIDFVVSGGQRLGTDAGIQELGKARLSGDLSRESYLRELVRRNELPESFDMDENDAELAQEGPPMGILTGKLPVKPGPGQGTDCSAMGAANCCCAGCPNEAKAMNDKCSTMGGAGCCCKGCPNVAKSGGAA